MNIFLDTETNSLAQPYLVELACNEFTIRCRPQAPIDNGAMAVNHITNEEVADLPLFREHPLYRAIKAMLEDPANTVIAHNVAFDLRVLENEDILPYNFICTKELAKKKWPDASSHSLQNLRYWLKLDGGDAHTAGGDVKTLKALWEALHTDGADGTSTSTGK
jgi:DNA polymerase III epsilon subunit-like protein